MNTDGAPRAESPGRGRRSIARAARTAGGLLLAVAGLVALVNLAVALFLDPSPPGDRREVLRRGTWQRGDATIAQYGIDVFRRVYPGKTDAEIRQLLRDQNQLPATYRPFIEVGPTARHDPTLNIHPAGFRFVGQEQGPWPPDPRAFNVFLFGGSVIASLGLPDDETIGARVQRRLRERTGRADVNLYAFGMSAFFSTQEVIYLQNLLRDGARPDLVLVADAGTDLHFWDGRPATAAVFQDTHETMTRLSRDLGRERGFGWHLVELARSLPVVRLAERRRAERGASPPPVTKLVFDPSAPPALGQPPDRLYARLYEDSLPVTDRGRIDAALARYRVNQVIAESVAQGFGFTVWFALLPTPTYKYDLALHPFRVPDDLRRLRYGYPVMRDLAESHRLGARFLWCADVFEHATRPMYVDAAHYNAPGTEMVAACVVDGILAAGRLAAARPPQGADATGRAEAGAADGGRVVARLFGDRATTEHLRLPERPAGARTLARDGVRLADDSPAYASVFEDVPVERGEGPRLYEVAVRLRPAGSDHVMLVMHLMGATTRSFWVALDPTTMRVRGANGLYALRAVDDGWYRLTLTAAADDPEIRTLRVQLYPRHGAPEAHGAVIFGGGEVRVRPAAASPSARRR